MTVGGQSHCAEGVGLREQDTQAKVSKLQIVAGDIDEDEELSENCKVEKQEVR